MNREKKGFFTSFRMTLSLIKENLIRTWHTMVMNKIYCTYIMTNIHNTVFYVGITNDIRRRAEEHISRGENGCTQRYHIVKIVWYEIFPDPTTAIAAEKKIKGWTRKKKITLIKNLNPTFTDLMKEK